MTDRPAGPDDQTNQETLLQGENGAASADPRSSGPLDGGRFPPGVILASRYRIVDLLGRGGMGEVYRAEDLKLGEAVALKLLPQELTSDGAALARLHQEVRMARRITHKNVVRVHDVGEADGLPFIAMEYIDGENLESLLKRIGRLPETKALELARELCAGLAAAHDCGMLHRDIKPANVMIDGEGHARINDFGLAGLAAELDRPERAGTALYMAPEQLAEGKASFASDVYSLGLVLYEMFSGERPFRASTRAELVAEHRDKAPSTLSSIVEQIDPLVEGTVTQCLQRDPANRPASPLAVAAALPGGDPLAAALAAGETPSPAMVAQASGQAALPRPLAAALLALTVLSVLAAARL
ncbi:MAG: serine/threonine-protein kinase, partial [Thermoanaerobaculia bacterium]